MRKSIASTSTSLATRADTQSYQQDLEENFHRNALDRLSRAPPFPRNHLGILGVSETEWFILTVIHRIKRVKEEPGLA